MKRSTRANWLLVLTALIWGVAFVAQDVAADALGPFLFNGLRMGLAALALLPVVYVMDKKAAREGTANRETGAGVPFSQMSGPQKRTLLLGGVCCGVMLTLGSAFQQIGINMGVGAGKAGFLTALYIVLVPLAGLFGGKKPGRLTWLAVAMAAAGLYLLCIRGNFTVDAGDGMLLLCALSFTGHILVIDRFSSRVDCVKMSCLQFAVTSALCMAAAVLTEPISLAAVRACLIPVLYAGIMSGAVGYTLQIVAQRDTDPTVASLLMSLESVFAVLAGWLILGDVLSVRELVGCVCMMGGIVLSQVKG